MELTVFLEFRLPFCPDAHPSGDDDLDLQLLGEVFYRAVW